MIKESRVDEALVHLFTTRMKLGMFDGKGKHPSTVYRIRQWTAVKCGH